MPDIDAAPSTHSCLTARCCLTARRRRGSLSPRPRINRCLPRQTSARGRRPGGTPVKQTPRPGASTEHLALNPAARSPEAPSKLMICKPTLPLCCQGASPSPWLPPWLALLPTLARALTIPKVDGLARFHEFKLGGSAPKTNDQVQRQVPLGSAPNAKIGKKGEACLNLSTRRKKNPKTLDFSSTMGEA